MFSASQLSQEQIDALKKRAAEGATLSDLQLQIKEDFDISITYMDTRFLILDLGIELLEEPKEEPKEEEKPAAVPTGTVTVSKEYSKIIIGLAIVAAVAVDRLSEHLRTRRAAATRATTGTGTRPPA